MVYQGQIFKCIFVKRHCTGVNLEEDFSLRSSRDGHLSSSIMSSTLLVFLHRLQAHLAAVFCTPHLLSPCHSISGFFLCAQGILEVFKCEGNSLNAIARIYTNLDTLIRYMVKRLR